MAQRKKNRKKCSGRTSHLWTLGCWGLGGCLNHSLCELHKTNTANISNVEKRCHRLWTWLRVKGRVKKLAIKLRFESCASFLVFNLISMNMSMLTPVFKIHWNTASTSLQMCWPHKSFPRAQTIMVNPSVPSRSSGTGRGRQWCHSMIIFCLSVEGKLSFDVLKPRGRAAKSAKVWSWPQEPLMNQQEEAVCRQHYLLTSGSAIRKLFLKTLLLATSTSTNR